MKTESAPTVIQPPGFPALPAAWETSSRVQPNSTSTGNLFVWTFRRKEFTRRPARVLFVIHGYGEHAGRYLHVPHYLKDSIDVLVAYDQRGHGRSEGLRGHVTTGFDQLAEDAEGVLRETIKQEANRYGKIQLHMLGHSMGGHVLLRLLPRITGNLPIASVSVSAPFLGIYGPVPVVKKTAAYLMANVWGSLQLSTGVDASTVSRDSGVVQTYKADRLVHDKMTPKMFTSMVAAMKDTLTHETYDCPLQFQIPGQDRLVDQAVSLAYFERLKVADKRLKTYPESFHEPMNDLDKEQFFADLSEWIEMHSA